jgi:hypothetical protein
MAAFGVRRLDAALLSPNLKFFIEKNQSGVRPPHSKFRHKLTNQFFFCGLKK